MRVVSGERGQRVGLRGVGFGAGLLAVALLVGFNVWVLTSPPVSRGSTVAGLGEGRACDPTDFGGDASLMCFEVPYADGEPVGIGFTIRNTAPIPMTIAAVESYGPPYLLPAYLSPELLADGFMFGLGAGLPFEPVEVGPGEEIPMQLVGTYRACEEVAEFSDSGSAAVVDNVALTLRWAFAETIVRLPLGAALSLPGPSRCSGS